MQERNCGLDLFRILCCIGVVNYHVMDDLITNPGGLIIYYGSSYCVPGFFLLAGFLFAGKKDFSIDYCEKKIVSIVRKLFGWIILLTIVHFILTGEVYNIWSQFTLSLLSKGVLPVAWFLFTYCICVFCEIPIYWLRRKNKIIFYILSIVWTVLLALGVGSNIMLNETQSLWFHIYIGYFLVGITIYDALYSWHNRRTDVIIRITLGGAFILSSYIYYNNIKHFAGLPHLYYGKWYYSVWLISLFFIIFHCGFFVKRHKKILSIISKGTFTVYLGHLPILTYITNIYPIQTLPEAIILVLFLFTILIVLSVLMKKLPLARKLI